MKRSATLGIGTLLIAFSPWTPTARAATDAEKQAAIRKGLAYLYQTQQPEGFWSYSGYERAATGAALFALLGQQDKWDSEAAPYQAAVDKAVSYLLKEAHIADVSTRHDGINICPVGEGSCKGIAWYDNADPIYTTGFVAPAIATYGLKLGSGTVATNAGPLAGMTWAQIAQGITNAYTASQSTGKTGNLGGAWHYATPGPRRTDRWTTQPAVISFLYDQLLGALTPQIVKDELKGWLASVLDASGAVCYEKSAAEPCEFVNAGEWLLATTFANSAVADAQVDAVLSSLNLTWPSKANSVSRGNFGHPNTMWTVYAGLESAIGLNDSRYINNFLTDCGAATNERPTSLPGDAACTWEEDYNQWLVKSQQADGSWADYSYSSSPMATALHINILGAVEIPRGTYKCPLRQAFWQSARVAWPVDSLSLGGQTYSKNDLLAILSAPVASASSSDASLVLVDELITAKLNLAWGSEKSPIATWIADADTLLSGLNSRLPYRVEASSPIGQKMAELANVLDGYNIGAMTSGCVSTEASNGGIRNRQQPDLQTRQPAALAAEIRVGNALASIDNAQKAQVAASSKVRPFTRKGVTSIAVSPDGYSLATATTDNRIRIFSLTTGALSLLLPAAVNFPTDLTFSPNGATLNGVGRDSLVHVWDALTGNELASFAGHEAALRAVAASPDSRLVASAGEDTRTMLWDAITRKLNKVLYGSADFLNALSFSPDSTLLASAGADARVLLFDVATGKIRFTLLGHAGSIDTLSFSPDGRALASAGQDTVIHVWDSVKGLQRLALAGHQAPIRTLAFSPDGQLIASGGEDTKIILWDAASGAVSKILSGSSGAVNALIFNPKSPSLISATETGEISIWNVAAGRRIFTFTVPI
jgi:WD40 repeat protein